MVNVLGLPGLLFARSGFTGSQAFPGCWAGDNEPNFGDNGLPSVIVAGQSAAMSAFAIWGHDIGGYQDTNFSQSPSKPVHAVGPVRLLLTDHADAPPGRAGNCSLPWRFGDQALANYQFFARLHVRLFPYIYTYAQQASMTGLPIIRPLVLLNQADSNTYGVQSRLLLRQRVPGSADADP